MRLFPIFLVLSLGFLFWIFDNFSSFVGIYNKYFFFAGGLHPGEQYIYIIILSFLVLGLSIFSLITKEKFVFNFSLVTYFLLLIFIALSTFVFSVDKYESMREFWLYTLMFLLLFYAYNFAYNSKDKLGFIYDYSLFLLILFIGSIFISVLINLQMMGVGGALSAWTSLFYQKNAYGGFVLLFLPIPFGLFVYSLVSKDYVKSLLFFISFIFGIFTLIFTASKASLLAFVISLPLYLAYFRVIKRLDFGKVGLFTKVAFTLSSGFSLVLLSFFLFFDKKFLNYLITSFKNVIFSLTNTFIARVDFWEASLKISKDFLFGCGFYNFSKVYPVYQSAFYYYSKDPHNYYLKLLSEIGPFGLALFLIIIVYLLYRFLKFSKLVDFKFLNSDLYKNNIDKDPENYDKEFEKNAVNLGIYIITSSIAIGIIQSSIHIFFDVDFKFSYILMIFLVNIFVVNGIIDNLLSNKFIFSNKLIVNVLSIIFVFLALLGLKFGFYEAWAYYIDKKVEDTLNLEDYKKIIKNTIPSSSKYVTLAEIYRVNYQYEEAIKYNNKAIELCPYNINAYISLSYIYLDKIDGLVGLLGKNSEYDSEIKKRIISLSNEIKKITLQAFLYDNKNYPDLYINFAQSYKYKSKFYNRLYKNIFLVVYPPSEYGNLMDIRQVTFGDVISKAYLEYLWDDIKKCIDKDNNSCRIVANYLYDPLVKYGIKTSDSNFYIIGGLPFYILAKELYDKNYSLSKNYFISAANAFKYVLAKDYIATYYYNVCMLYTADYPSALEISHYIDSLSLTSNSLDDEQKEKLRFVKINNYAVLSHLYKIMGLNKFASYYEKLYRKYKK